MRWLSAIAVGLIVGYQRLISPILGASCRFYPSCSEYSRQAFLSKSFGRACWLTVRRLVKCQPFHPGGYDPLDEETEDSQ